MPRCTLRTSLCCPPTSPALPRLPPQFRARLWLFISFLTAVGAVGGAVAVLLSASQDQTLAGMGVGSVLQCFFILLAAILFWAFRSGDAVGGYGYIHS